MSEQSPSRLDQVIANYLDAIEKGQEPDRNSLLREHADLSEDLQSFFQNHDVMRRVGFESTSGVQPNSTHEDQDQQAVITTQQNRAVHKFETPILRDLGAYSLVRELGVGGMGQVFLAIHRRMNRQVAIKLLPAEMAQDDALVKRFHREAQVAAQLTHPNIVTAHDAGQETRFITL